ncbi:MerR family transcriptional regulator [Paenibacillus cremeus]|nr:MerR family transcriptional regulator [Paenibacillus cremeus]
MYTTREAAQALNVSPTTIKRWASHFQSRFSKDDQGHYVFTDHDLEALNFIKEQLEKRQILSQIVLEEDQSLAATPSAVSPSPALSPVPPSAPAASTAVQASEPQSAAIHPPNPAPQLNDALRELTRRLTRVEYSLSQKAEDVVTLQILEHRNEIDELSKQVKILSQSLEGMQRSLTSLLHQAEVAASIASMPKPPKRKSMLASLFQL